MIHQGRFTTNNDRDIVVLLIGARVNRFWLLPIALPVLSKMQKMVKSLSQDPDSGFLGYQSLGLSTVQYWRSAEDLLRWVNDREKLHHSTQRAYYRKLFSQGAVGVWHEMYCVKAGCYEAIYNNMPDHGLSKVLDRQKIEKENATSKRRLFGMPSIAETRDADTATRLGHE